MRRRGKLGVLAFAATACLAPHVVHAQDEQPPAPPEDEPRLRVAVLILPVGELDPALTDDLSELLVGAVAARGGVTIVGKAELQAQLAQDDAATLDCVGSMACLGRMGVQLGVAEVVAGTLARRGDLWVFNLNRTDVRRGEVVGRVFREVEGDLPAVADALAVAVPELYERAARPATLVVAGNVRGAQVSLDGVIVGSLGPTPLREEGVSAGEHEVTVRAPGHRPWRRRVRLHEGAELHLEARLVAAIRTEVHPLVWIGGGAALASLAAAIGLAVASQAHLETTREQRASMEVTRAELLGYYEAREREAIAADVLFATAGVLAAAALVSIAFPVRHPMDEDGPLALRFGPGGLALVGALP